MRKIFDSFGRKIKIKDGKRMSKNLRMKGCWSLREEFRKKNFLKFGERILKDFKREENSTGKRISKVQNFRRKVSWKMPKNLRKKRSCNWLWKNVPPLEFFTGFRWFSKGKQKEINSIGSRGHEQDTLQCPVNEEINACQFFTRDSSTPSTAAPNHPHPVPEPDEFLISQVRVFRHPGKAKPSQARLYGGSGILILHSVSLSVAIPTERTSTLTDFIEPPLVERDASLRRWSFEVSSVRLLY